MQVTFDIPDDLAARVSGEELVEHLREDALVGAYCRDWISRTDLQRVLGFATGDELDGYLKQRGIEHGAYGPDDLADDLKTLEVYGVGKSWLG